MPLFVHTTIPFVRAVFAIFGSIAVLALFHTIQCLITPTIRSDKSDLGMGSLGIHLDAYTHPKNPTGHAGNGGISKNSSSASVTPGDIEFFVDSEAPDDGGNIAKLSAFTEHTKMFLYKMVCCYCNMHFGSPCYKLKYVCIIT